MKDSVHNGNLGPVIQKILAKLDAQIDAAEQKVQELKTHKAALRS